METLNNPLKDVDFSNMREGETRVIQVHDNKWFSTKKEKHIVMGKTLEYKVGTGDSREEALKNLDESNL